MENNFNCRCLTLFVLLLPFSLQAQKPGRGTVTDPLWKSVASLCAPASAKADLDINNVRATILNGGDMWWDLSNGGYLVPKPAPGTTGPTSLFAGGLWIGGVDASGILKMAAMTYRQTGVDFWAGPLNSSGNTDFPTCMAWDKIFKINKQDVKDYVSWYNSGAAGPNPVDPLVMDVIMNWPATGAGGQSMAPYYDANSNGVYDPASGDYPDFWLGDGSRPLGQTSCDAKLRGDQVLFWVFNDAGNNHTQTGGPSIGLEVQAQAFAFQTNDPLNDMTFYNYTLINKSSFRLDSTFFGVYIDADLGSGADDYIGCDVGLGLGYCYNGDMVDDNPPTGQIPYGANPPAIGLDFFEGPRKDPNGLDDSYNSEPASYQRYGDGIIDNERLGMSKFVYWEDDGSVTSNPTTDLGFYLRLKGRYLDNTSITYGGTGHLTGPSCDYFFPGESDPMGFGTNMVPQLPWDEAISGNVPSDRKFVQSAGPFTLQPGGINTVTTGVVWARSHYGGNLASVTLMKGADAYAQDLFNNCFNNLMYGPDAPALTIQELKNELVLTWTNPANYNNFNENYSEDYDLSSGADAPYKFQGYIVYQLKDETVTSADIYNVDKARIVFQCDIADGVKQIVNYKHDLELQAMVPQEMVNGADLGISHSCSVTEDKFASGTPELVNHKTYYYAVIAYGYSSTLDNPDFAVPKDYLPFIRSTKIAGGIFNHSAIPHITSPEAGGTLSQSAYGTGVKLKRIEGHGNGGCVLDLSSASVAEILGSTSRSLNPVYSPNRGPVKIKVIDPLLVPEHSEFEFKLLGLTSAANWKLTNLTTGVTVTSDKTIALANEQIINGQSTGSTTYSIPTWGISVNVSYSDDPLEAGVVNGGFLEGTVEFADPTKQWLSGLADEDGEVYSNWIRSGVSTAGLPIFHDAIGPNTDPYQYYENILGKTWAPYRLCATGLMGTATDPTPTTVYAKAAPAYPNQINQNKLSNLASVDVVITSDKSLWTRCPVLEECDDKNISVGGARKLMMRNQASVDKNGYDAADGAAFNAAEGNLVGTTGMGWFPGYAINVETGERLNMAFGEDSWLVNENGADMKWNPTSSTLTAGGEPIFGGKHYIYVFGHNGDALFGAGDANLPGAPKDVPRYDQGKAIHDILEVANTTFSITMPGTSDSYKREVFLDAMWVNIPLSVPGHALFECDVKFRLRVAKAYARGYTTNTVGTSDTALSPQNLNRPMYTFNTSEIETHLNDAATAEEAMALINVVPNPYYAYSAYEKKAFDNVVKITNLPEKCSVVIYSLNGTLVRKFSKNDAKTSLDWDLRNSTDRRIASGMYIIHVTVPEVGEKTLKWFGVMRAQDLDSY